MREHRRRVILFTRYPRAGEAKTRMIPVLGARGAAELQRRMTEFVSRRLRAAADRLGADVEIRYAGGDLNAMREWLGDGVRFADQGEGDLGQKMRRAVRSALDGGVETVVLVGADCPCVDFDLLGQAFGRAGRGSVVIGPAVDGGYYLLAVCEEAPLLFSDMPWGSDRVLSQTLEAAQASGLRAVLLPEHRDIDTPADLEEWDHVADDDVRSRISVVIPALNEERHIERTVGRVMSGCNVDCVVVDGGSQDRTVELAARAGAVVRNGARGRACQQQAGVEATDGEILLFLHADTLLPPRYDMRARSILKQPGTAGGAFRFAVDAPLPALRWVEWLTNARARLLQMPYGDQAIFCGRQTCLAVGGIPLLPLMEDVEFVRRLRRRGRIRIADDPVTTSARRWLHLGVWRTTWRNQLLLAGYYLGVSPDRLAGVYYRGKGGRGV